MTRVPYRQRIAGAACDMDAPRTPWAAAKERRGFGCQLITRYGRQLLVRTVRGEAIAILSNQLSRSL